LLISGGNLDFALYAGWLAAGAQILDCLGL
jgi:hypothetical protein